MAPPLTVADYDAMQIRRVVGGSKGGIFKRSGRNRELRGMVDGSQTRTSLRSRFETEIIVTSACDLTRRIDFPSVAQPVDTIRSCKADSVHSKGCEWAQ